MCALFLSSCAPVRAGETNLPAPLSSPDRAVVCHNANEICFDRFGPSIGLTEAFPLLDVYLTHRKDPNTFPVLKQALRIADHLQLAEVEVSTLRNYLAAETNLRRAGLWLDDVPEALRMIPPLEELPQSWTWKQAHYAMRTVAYILRQGFDATRIGEFLAFHHALERGGITETYFVEFVTALEDAGVHGPRKRRILDRLIAQAALQVDVEDLQHQSHALTAEITHLEAQRKELSKRVDKRRRRIEALRAQETAGRERVEGLAGEVAGYEQERTMLQAARLLLEGRQAAAPVSATAALQLQPHKPGQQGCHARPVASPRPAVGPAAQGAPACTESRLSKCGMKLTVG
jgi:hypothetical protein